MNISFVTLMETLLLLLFPTKATMALFISPALSWSNTVYFSTFSHLLVNISFAQENFSDKRIVEAFERKRPTTRPKPIPVEVLQSVGLKWMFRARMIDDALKSYLFILIWFLFDPISRVILPCFIVSGNGIKLLNDIVDVKIVHVTKSMTVYFVFNLRGISFTIDRWVSPMSCVPLLDW